MIQQRLPVSADTPVMKKQSLRSDFLPNQHGTATVEYIVISLLVTIGAAAAISSLGPFLLALFNAQATWLALPIH